VKFRPDLIRDHSSIPKKFGVPISKGLGAVHCQRPAIFFCADCIEFIQIIDNPDNSEELLLEAGDILYYAVLTSKNLRKIDDHSTDPWPDFFLIDESSKEKGIKFNEYAKNQMLLDTQKLAKLGTKIYKL
jgi:hypothetical protein